MISISVPVPVVLQSKVDGRIVGVGYRDTSVRETDGMTRVPSHKHRVHPGPVRD